MELREKLKQMRRNSMVLEIDGEETYQLCGTRFGGVPDVPPDFVWPTFEGKDCAGEVKARPLAFLAQFNCEELAQYDTEHLLPAHGLLSFFYETSAMPWGFAPKDKGGARVFWFEDTSRLAAANAPAEMEEDSKFPIIRVRMTQEASYPGWEDFSEAWPGEDDEAFEAAQEALGVEEPGEQSKLLGWPDVIQNNMAMECAFVTQGYDLGKGWSHIPEDVRQRVKETALDRWRLLFQLDTVEHDDFCVMFGDCGRIYFYIKKEDLLARRFDQVWLILQCY